MKELIVKGLEKLKEPTTWAGIASLAAAIGVTVSPELTAAIGAAGAALAGLALVIYKENK